MPLRYLSHLVLQNSPEYLNQAFKDALGCYGLASLKAAKMSSSYISY